MSVKFISKPLGGKAVHFRIKGCLAAAAATEVGEELLMIRVCRLFFPFDDIFVFEVRHQRRGRIVESICDRTSFIGEAKLIEAVRTTVIAAEAEEEARAAVEKVRSDVVAQLGHPAYYGDDRKDSG